MRQHPAQYASSLVGLHPTPPEQRPPVIAIIKESDSALDFSVMPPRAPPRTAIASVPGYPVVYIDPRGIRQLEQLLSIVGIGTAHAGTYPRRRSL